MRNPLAEQIAHFAAVIRGEAEPLVSARDGLQNLRVTEAVVQRREPAASYPRQFWLKRKA